MARLDAPNTPTTSSKTQFLDNYKVNLYSTASIPLMFQGQNIKKRFASLRFCVSSLHRDHANLLCIVKRLFNARAETRASIKGAKYVYKVILFFLRPGPKAGRMYR
jgi:hypothetical protein